MYVVQVSALICSDRRENGTAESQTHTYDYRMPQIPPTKA